MHQIAIISGKGGTGKTVLTACFASLAEKKAIVDCDVDAANLYLLLHPEVEQREEFKASKLAVIDRERCTECGICAQECRFEAISGMRIDPIACEGCELCRHLCPENAISMEKITDGEWYVSRTKYGPFVHARLRAGGQNSGKLVALIKQKAQEMAIRECLCLSIVDGPPGVGCPVISTLSGADLALVVTEPTLSGLHDCDRVIGLTDHFHIKTAVCINKFDLNRTISKEIERYCQQKGIPIVGKIVFDEAFQESLSRCVPLVEMSDGSIAKEIKTIWDNLRQLLNTNA